MSLRILTGKSFIPPYIHHAFPTKHEEDDRPPGKASGGGATSLPTQTSIPAFVKEAETPAGFTPIATIEGLFGGIPHDSTQVKSKQVGIRDHVMQFPPDKPEWIVKRFIYGDSIEDKIAEARSDALLKSIIKEFFPEFIVPESYYYISDKNCFVVSKFLSHNTNLEHFHSMSPELKALMSIVVLGFGLSDTVPDNVCESLTEKYSVGEAGCKEEKSKYIVLDAGISYVNNIRETTFSTAKKEVEVHKAPFVDVNGNNSYETYRKIYDQWNKYITEPDFVKRLDKVCQPVGIRFQDYYPLLINNFRQYHSNLDMYLAAANKKLPSLLLKEEGLIAEKLKKTELGVGKRKTITGFKESKQIVLELSGGYLIFVKRGSNGKLLIKNVLDKTENVLEAGLKLKIGRPNPYQTESSSDEQCLLLDAQDISVNHVQIQNINDEKIIISDIQDIPVEGAKKKEKIRATAYWK